MIHGEAHRHHRLFHNAGWSGAWQRCLSAAAACTQRIRIMTRWMDCYARETAMASRMRRYISKYMPKYMSKLQFAPVFDIHHSPLSPSLRCILRCLPACFAARSAVCTVESLCMYMPTISNQRSIASQHRNSLNSTPMLSLPCARSTRAATLPPTGSLAAAAPVTEYSPSCVRYSC